MIIASQSIFLLSPTETMLEATLVLAILIIILLAVLLAACIDIHLKSSGKKANGEDEINIAGEEISNIVAAARDELDQMSEDFLAEIENRMSKTGD